MSWCKIHLTHSEVTDGTYARITRVLEDITFSPKISQPVRAQLASFEFPKDGSPEDNCAKPPKIIYLSPELSVLAKTLLLPLLLEPCDPPGTDSLEVFTSWNNNEAAWTILKASSRK